ncbi:MAG: hypothetical protein M3516_09585 [Actinomycetota bacterium]|nr:hypothetical protein [Actinomycetota bacterium]
MSISTCKRAFACGLAAAVVVATPVAAAPTDAHRARMGVRYLVTHQSADGSFPGFSARGSTADAVVAMVAARRAPDAIKDALDYLELNTGSASLGQKAKLVLAAVAGGRDPRSFGGVDLVAAIQESKTDRGRYRDPDPDPTKLFTQVLTMLALHAADQDVPRNAARWLRDAQCGDGGWQYDTRASDRDNQHCWDGTEFDYSRSDTNTTALAVMALEHAPDVSLPSSPFAYFKSARDEARGGWRYDHRKSGFGSPSYTDTNSTSLVLQAFAARDRAIPNGALAALRDLQYRLCGKAAGAFANTWARNDGRWFRSPSRQDAALVTPTVGATVAAIPAILGRPLPIAEFTVTKAAPARPTCG